MTFEGFSPAAFEFYAELEQNNNREWWLANKARYESVVRAPILALMEDLAPEFGAFKLYRPYRDTRFSGNKDPYKENAAMSVFGRGSTGLYLELNAKGLDFGGGYWQPGKDQLAHFRETIDDLRLYGDLEATIEELAEDGFELYRIDALKSMPRGYRADHPRIDLLRLQHMVMFKVVAPADWMFGPEAAEMLAQQWRKVNVWNEWLASAIGPSTQPPRSR